MAGIDTYTKLMLHMNGSDASTTFTDSESTPKTMTANGNAQIDTAQKVFGTASGLFDGNTDSVSTPNSADFDLGTAGNGDFTVDFRVRFANLGGADAVHGFVCPQTISTTNGWQTYFINSTTKQIQVWSGSGTTRGINWSPSINTWYHIAIVRSGGTITIYIDGTSIGTVADGDFSSDGAEMTVGAANSTDVGSLNGWLDEVRVSKGIARWTANFTPPTEEYSAFTAYTKTFDETIVISEPSFIRASARIFLDTINLSEVFAKAHGYVRTFTETAISIIDSGIDFIRGKFFSDTINSSDAHQKSMTRNLSDGIGIYETFSRAITKTWSEAVSLTDLILKQIGKSFSETLNLSETFTKIYVRTKSFTETITVADIIVRLKGVTFNDAVNISDSIKKYINGALITIWTHISNTTATWSKIIKSATSFTKSAKPSDAWTKVPKDKQ